MRAAVFIFAAAVAAPLFAADPQADLKQLRERIGAIEQTIRSDRNKRDTAQSQLASVETRIGPIASRLRDLRDNAKRLKKELQRLDKEQVQLAARLNEQRQFLARQLRSAYAAGRDVGLRALLNQGDPSRTARMWGYHQALGRARAEQISLVHTLSRQLLVSREQTVQRSAELAKERGRAEQALAELESVRRDRAAMLVSLKAQLSRGDRHLAQMRGNEKRLLDLIESVRRAVVDVPAGALEERRFGKRRGALGWPVEGSIVARFGASRAQHLKWDGIKIAASAGAPVKAVGHGRVAYANWLRGYGLLVILDHGDSFMSLYGHNESLTKDVGDWVEPGDVIAYVGDSGGQLGAALYFGVRKALKPQNPLIWLQASARRN